MTRKQESERKNKKEIIKMLKEKKETVFHTTITLDVLNDNPIIFFKHLNYIIKELSNQNILLKMKNRDGSNTSSEFYCINQNSWYDYFSITAHINGKIIKLFYHSKDLYLQGFILQTTYWYFEDSTLTNTNTNNITAQILPFVGSYVASNGLEPHNEYSWQTIYSDFLRLTNPNINENEIKVSIIGIILATSESIRFRSVKNAIIKSQDHIPIDNFWILINVNPITQNWNFFQQIIKNWNRGTHNAINYFLNSGNWNIYFHQQLITNGLRIMVFNKNMDNVLQQQNIEKAPIIETNDKKIEEFQKLIDNFINICKSGQFHIIPNKSERISSFIELLQDMKTNIVADINLQAEITTIAEFPKDISTINDIFELIISAENIPITCI